MKNVLFLFAIIIFPTVAFAQAEPVDTDGDGYINISTLEHLRRISEDPSYWDKNFELDNDIDAAATKEWNDGRGFSPIKYFSGNFDGCGFSIDSLFIKRRYQYHLGMFWALTGTLRNLTLTNCYISNTEKISGSMSRENYIGGFAGLLEGSLLNCHMTGTVEGEALASEKGYEVYVGGLVGKNEGVIQFCSTKGNIKMYVECDFNYQGNYGVIAKGWCGGLVGYHNGTLKNCYSDGSIHGGLVGAGSGATHRDVDPEGGVAGIAGLYLQPISNCYSIAKIDASGSENTKKTFAIACWGHYMDIELPGCFFDAEKTGADYGRVPSSTEVEMKTKSIFTNAGWDFDNIWDIDPAVNDGYPFLRPSGENLIKYPTDSSYVSKTISSILWSERKNAVRYVFELARDRDFDERMIRDSCTTPYYTLSEKLQEDSTYFCRVSCLLSNGSRFRSNTISFTTVDQGIRPQDTDGDGYINISNLMHLRWVSMNTISWDWKYELDSDIDASWTKDWNEGKGFLPIGNEEAPFTGVFDGGGRNISNLTINRPEENNIGFFGKTSREAIIEVLSIIDCNIVGGTNVGGLVGYNSGEILGYYKDSIIACTTKGSISGRKNVGGIAGANVNKIKHCQSFATVSGDTCTGGIAGYIENSFLTECRAESSVSGISEIGGLVGTVKSSTLIANQSTGPVAGISITGGLVGHAYRSTIAYCFAIAAVKGDSCIAGFLGYAKESDLKKCYSSCEVIGNENVNAFAASDSNTTAEGVFWNKRMPVTDKSDLGTGISDGTLKNIVSMTQLGWDFKRLWDYAPGENSGFPVINLRRIPSHYAVEPKDNDNDGKLDISMPGHLVWLSVNRTAWDKPIEILNDIDMGTDNAWGKNNNFSPIGTNEYPYTGRVSGNGYTISNLNICRPDESYSGLFGKIKHEWAFVDDLKLESCYVYGLHYSGCIAGFFEGARLRGIEVKKSEIHGGSVLGLISGVNYAELSYCNAEGKIEGYYRLGGCTGASFGEIERCRANVEISGVEDVGGIAGYSNRSVNGCFAKATMIGSNLGGVIGYGEKMIENCSAEVVLNGGFNVGGIVGYQPLNSQLINSNASGSVSGNYNVGGIAGHNRGSISRSYSHCSVNGIEHVGGLVGRMDGEFNLKKEIAHRVGIKKSFATGDVQGANFVGGLIGLNYGLKALDSYARGNIICTHEESENVGIFSGRSTGDIEYYVKGGMGTSLDCTSVMYSCYATGTITGGSPSYLFIGTADYTNARNCIWDGAKNEGNSYYNLENMKIKETYTNIGWDFDNIWDIDSAVNDGYPFFREGLVAVEELPISEPGKLSVYPNPARDFIRIAGQSGRAVSIYNIRGVEVYSGRESKIDISELSPGLYFVREQDGEFSSGTFLIE